VQYSDGDREDMDQEELQYAMDFYIKQRDDKRKMRHVQSESGEDENYRPSPEEELPLCFISCHLFMSSLCLHFLTITEGH
jgi:hypothetical protein